MPAVLHWSSGKDAAFALHSVRQEGSFEIRALLTTVSEQHERVAIHGVRRALLHAQAEALCLPLIEVPLPAACSNEEYEKRIGQALSRLKAEGLEDHLFGDLHLADIRAYRESHFASMGLRVHFPLWGMDSSLLAREMIAAGIRAHITVLDPARMPPNYLGASFDEVLLAALPEGVDPCGERGEFHTLVSDMPGFERPLDLEPGLRVEREGFLYQDFTLNQGASPST